ncbi:chaperonin [Tulasnella sp. 427]|nr:chaperonin [Tulasnella sp. 427]
MNHKVVKNYQGLVPAVAGKTNGIFGDGTITTVVLTRAVFSEGVKNVTAGQKAVNHVISFLDAEKRVITTSEEIAQVAIISANGNTHIGNLIATAMEKVGKEGVINIKEGKTASRTALRPCGSTVVSSRRTS